MGVRIKGYRVNKDKLTKALPWISRAEAGKIFMVRGNWVNSFLDECQIFKGHRYTFDDQVDVVSGCYQIDEYKLSLN